MFWVYESCDIFNKKKMYIDRKSSRFCSEWTEWGSSFLSTLSVCWKRIFACFGSCAAWDWHWRFGLFNLSFSASASIKGHEEADITLQLYRSASIHEYGYDSASYVVYIHRVHFYLLWDTDDHSHSPFDCSIVRGRGKSPDSTDSWQNVNYKCTNLLQFTVPLYVPENIKLQILREFLHLSLEFI